MTRIADDLTYAPEWDALIEEDRLAYETELAADAYVEGRFFEVDGDTYDAEDAADELARVNRPAGAAKIAQANIARAKAEGDAPRVAFWTAVAGNLAAAAA